jgi:hypothetical protein
MNMTTIPIRYGETCEIEKEDEQEHMAVRKRVHGLDCGLYRWDTVPRFELPLQLKNGTMSLSCLAAVMPR